jgi:hypothetical protein
MKESFGKIMTFVKRNWQFLTENIPITIAIIVTFYVIRMNQITKMSAEELLSSVLLILGLLAASILLERFGTLRSMAQMTKETHEYLNNNAMKPSVDLVVSDRKSLAPLETRLQPAKEIAITGGSLFRLANEYLGYFEHKAEEGCSLKFMLLHPESEASKLVAEYVVYEVKDYNIYDTQLITSLNNLYGLKQRYGALVEIRTYKSVPPFSLLICDPNKDYGSIMVELYTYKVPTRERPQFTLQRSRDPRWYSVFLQQFNQMWEKATPWEPK